MKIRNPYQSIKYSQVGSTTQEKVEWEDWSLKMAKEELNQLEVTLLTPDDWLNVKSTTGIGMQFGDELHLYGGYGVELDDPKRFGGYITDVNGKYESGVSKISVTAIDYRHALKQRIYFSNYKSLPLNMGPNSTLMAKLKPSNSLYDLISDMCNTVGFTDLTNVTNPYKFKMDGTTNMTRTVGSNSVCEIVDKAQFGNPPPGYMITFGSGDTEVCFTVWSDATGFELAEYPNFGLNYDLPYGSGVEFGLRFTINSTYYYVPWFSSLSEYSGNKLRGLNKIYTNRLSTMVVPLGQLLMEKYPDTKNTLTKVEIVSKRADGIVPGYLIVDNLGMIDGQQAIPSIDKYEYKDGNTIINEYCQKTNHIFEVNPYKLPTLHNLQFYLSDKSIIEGENLITADTVFNDDELANNFYVVSKLEENKALFAQSYVKDSHQEIGLIYDKLEENSDYKTRDDIVNYAHDQAATRSRIIPAVSCTVVPDFTYRPGQVLYVYIPSLGIDKSLEILEVNYGPSSCSLGLGMPSEPYIKLLKNLDKNQKLGLTRGSYALDNINKQKETRKFSTVYRLPKGTLHISGKDLVETNVNINKDLNSDKLPIWMSPELVNKVTIDERGATINWNGNQTQNLLPFEASNAEFFISISPYTFSGCNFSNMLENDPYNIYNGGYKSPKGFWVEPTSNTCSLELDTSDAIACSAGEKVSAGVWISKYEASVGSTVTLQIVWYNNVGGVISTSSGTPTAVSGTWQQLKLENVTAPTNTAEYTIKLTSTQTPTYRKWKFDRVQTNKGSTLNPYTHGGAWVALPTSILFNSETFYGIRSIKYYYNNSISINAVSFSEVYYSEYDPDDESKNFMFQMASSSGNYGPGDLELQMNVSLFGTIGDIKYGQRQYHGLTIVKNYEHNPTGTTTVYRKEIVYDTAPPPESFIA